MKLDTEDLKAFEPLIEAVVRRVLAETRDGKITLTETEAARRLGVKWYTLRDARLKGRIKASGTLGRKILYTLADLDEHLAASQREGE